MRRILMSAAMAAMIAGLAPVGSVQAQHMASLDRSAADAALEAIGLGANGERNISWDRAEFSSGIYTFTNLVIHVPGDISVDESDLPDGKPAVDESDLAPPRDIHVARMVLDSPRLDSAGALLLHAFALDDVVIEDSEGRVGIDHIAINAPNAIMSAELGRIINGEDPDAFDAHWDDYRFALAAIDGMSAAFTEEDGPVSFNLDRVAMVDNTDDTLGRFEVLGFGFEGPSSEGPVRMSLTEMSANGIATAAYRSVMDAASSGAGQGAISAAYYDASISNDMKLADAFRMRGLDITVPGIVLTLDELVATMDLRGDILTSHAHMGSLRVRPDGDSPTATQFAAAIGMLGYGDLDISLEANSRYDSQAGRMTTMGDNYFTLRDGLRLEFSQDFGGYLEYMASLQEFARRSSETTDEEDTEQNPAEMLAAMSPLIIHRFGVRIIDQSMLARSLAAGASTQGITPEEMRAQASLLVGVGLMSAPPAVSRTVLAEIATALAAFINQGGSLDITLAPPQPLTVGEIAELGSAETIDFDALGLTVTTAPPAGD